MHAAIGLPYSSSPWAWVKDF